MLREGFAIVFSAPSRSLPAVSLNRLEQSLFDYVQKHPEERHHWLQKVRAVSARATDPHAASLQLDAELWYYLSERAAVVAELRQALQPTPARRISLRNLAEHLIRLWAPPRAKPKPSHATPRLGAE